MYILKHQSQYIYRLSRDQWSGRKYILLPWQPNIQQQRILSAF